MQYKEFVIRMRDLATEPVGEREAKVEVLQSPVDQMREAETVTYRGRELARALNRLELKRLKQMELITLGEQLADLLLPQQVRAMLLRSIDLLGDDEGLRLRLIINEPLLADLPWEYLYLDRSSAGQQASEKNSSGFLVLDPRISMVRHEAMDRRPGTVATTPPLKLVIGLASPANEQPLDLAQERGYIEEALAEVVGIDTHIIEHLTVAKFETAIHNAQIFHFAGHGTFRLDGSSDADTRKVTLVSATNAGQEATDGTPLEGAGALAFEDDAGNGRFFPADKLAQNLSTVRLVVLGACETGRRDGINVWIGVAPALMRAGVPAAVAMQYEVYDNSAIAFSRRFYQAVAAGLSLDEAVTAGRLAVLNLEAPFDLDFGVPVLYLRAADGILFPEAAADASLESQRQATRLTIQQQIKEIQGIVTGVEAGTIENAQIDVDQTAGRVSQGGKLTGVQADRIAGGSIDVEQTIDEVGEGGTVTGARIG